jgi:carboxypeptidase T
MRQWIGYFGTAVSFLIWATGSVSAAQLATFSVDPSRATYQDVQKFMRDLVAKYPQNVRSFVLGASDSGQNIEGVMIGNGPVKNLVVASHHGNEYGSVEVARGVAASLAEHPITGQTIYVIPVLNINGYNAKDRLESAAGNAFDPNRNYPGPCGTEGPFTLKSTQALAKFVDKEGIVASATLHTFYPAVVYPWGLGTQDLSTPYDDLFKGLVQAATVESKYQTGNSTEVIYAANGTYEDYAFWKHGIWSLLFELGNSHNPSGNDVAEMVATNVPGIRRMMEQAPRVRAEDHAFKGHCDKLMSLRRPDKHDE